MICDLGKETVMLSQSSRAAMLWCLQVLGLDNGDWLDGLDVGLDFSADVNFLGGESREVLAEYKTP